MPVSQTEIAPSREDPVVRGFAELIGGPWGRHAFRPGSRFWTPLRIVLALTVVVCVLGWAQKEPCRSPQNWVHQHQYTEMCYSDVVALYFAEHLDVGQIPYADHAVEYPVLIGGMMEAAAFAARAFPAAERPQRFFDLTALMLAICALVLVWSTFRLAGRRRPFDAAMVALAPVLLLHAFTNWDLLAAALTSVGMLAFARNRPGWAGVALGLGVAAKLYPLLVLLLVLPALAVRAGRWRVAVKPIVTAVAAWLVVDLPIWIAYPAAFGRFYADNLHRPPDFDSLIYAFQYLVGRNSDPFSGVGFTVLSALLELIALGAAVGVIFHAPRRPRVAQAAFLVLLAFLLANKVWSPQYALWLLGFAVLARPRWGTFLAWQASEVWLLFTRFYFFVGLDVSGQGVPEWVFLLAVVLRDCTLCYLAGLVIRDIYHPEHDPVRASGEDDPMAGPLGSSLGSATCARLEPSPIGETSCHG